MIMLGLGAAWVAFGIYTYLVLCTEFRKIASTTRTRIKDHYFKEQLKAVAICICMGPIMIPLLAFGTHSLKPSLPMISLPNNPVPVPTTVGFKKALEYCEMADLSAGDDFVLGSYGDSLAIFFRTEELSLMFLSWARSVEES